MPLKIPDSDNGGVSLDPSLWKDSQCVTSLYDAYLASEKENEHLKENIQELSSENNRLRSKLKKIQDAQSKDDDELSSVCVMPSHIHLERKVKVITKENESLLVKLEAEEASTKDLSRKLSSYKEKYEEQLKIYRQKYAIDPLAPKRVSLSVTTLTESLQTALYENETYASTITALQSELTKLQHERQECDLKLVDAQMEITKIKKKRVYDIIKFAIGRISTHSISVAMSTWKEQTIYLRNNDLKIRQEKEQQVQEELQLKLFNETKIKLLLSRIFEGLSRSVFRNWRDYTLYRKSCRELIHKLLLKKTSVIRHTALTIWNDNVKEIVRKERNARKVILSLMNGKVRKAFSRWTQYNTAFISKELDKSNTELKTKVEVLEEKLKELERANDGLEHENLLLVTNSTNEKQVLKQSITSLCNKQEILVENMSVSIQSAREKHFVYKVFTSYKIFVDKKKRLQRLSDVYHSTRNKIKSGRAVSKWHQFTKESHKLHRIHLKIQRNGIKFTQIVAMNNWKETLESGRHSRRVVANFIRNLDTQHQFRRFRKWASVVSHTLSIRLQWNKRASVILRRYWISVALYKWKRNDYSLKLVCDRIDFTTTSLRNRELDLLERIYKRWQFYKNERIHKRLLYLRVFNRLVNSKLDSAFRTWLKNMRGEELTSYSKSLATLESQNVNLTTELSTTKSQLEELKASYNILKVQSSSQFETLRRNRQVMTEKLLSHRQSNVHHKVLANAFREWTAFKKASLRDKKILSRFVNQWTDRRISRIFDRWSLYVHTSKRNRTIISRFRTRYESQSTSKCFYQWNFYMHSEKHTRRIITNMTRRLNHFTTIHRFNIWSSFVSTRVAARKTVARVFHSTYESNLQVGFIAFFRNVRFHQLSALSKLSRQKLYYKITGNVFAAWKKFSTTNKRQRKTLATFVRQMQNSLVGRTFDRWSTFKNVKRSEKKLAMRVFNALCHRTLHLGFKKWRLYNANCVSVELEKARAATRNQAKEIAELQAKVKEMSHSHVMLKKKHRASIVTMKSNTILTDAFSTWKSTIVEWKRQNYIVRRFVNQMRNRSVTMCYNSWVSFTSLKKRHRLNVKIINVKTNVRVIKSAFCHWIEFYNERQHAKALILKLRTRVSYSCFQMWKSYIDRRNFLRQFFFTQGDRVKSHVFSQWIAALSIVKHEEAITHKVSLMLNTKQKGVQELRFSQWKRFTKSRIRNRVKVSRFRLKSSTRKLRLVFTALHNHKVKRSTCRRRVLRVFKTRERKTRRHAFGKWKEVVVVEIQVENSRLQNTSLKFKDQALDQLMTKYNTLKTAHGNMAVEIKKRGRKASAYFIKTVQHKNLGAAFAAWASLCKKRRQTLNLLHNFKRRKENALCRKVIKSLSTYINRLSEIQDISDKVKYVRVRNVVRYWHHETLRHKICNVLHTSKKLRFLKRNFKEWRVCTLLSSKTREVLVFKRQSCLTILLWKKDLERVRLVRKAFRIMSHNLLDDYSFDKGTGFNSTNNSRMQKRPSISASGFINTVKDTDEMMMPLQLSVQRAIHQVSNAPTIEDLSFFVSECVSNSTSSNCKSLLFFVDSVSNTVWSSTNSTNISTEAGGILNYVRTCKTPVFIKDVVADLQYVPSVDSGIIKPQLKRNDSHASVSSFFSEADDTKSISAYFDDFDAPTCLYGVPVILNSGNPTAIAMVITTGSSKNGASFSDAMFITSVCAFTVEAILNKCIPSTSISAEDLCLSFKTRKTSDNTPVENTSTSTKYASSKKEEKLIKSIHRLKEKMYEKEAELEEAKDALIDLKHGSMARDMAVLASPSITGREENTFSQRREGVMIAQVSNMKNALVRAEADNLFLAKAVQTAVNAKGEIPAAIYQEAMRTCERLSSNTTISGGNARDLMEEKMRSR